MPLATENLSCHSYPLDFSIDLVQTMEETRYEYIFQ
jgi:hypothetical protein